MISEGLKRIKDSDRLIIELKDIKGLTYEEISIILSIPMGTVKSKLYRARENLKKVVEDIIKKGDFKKWNKFLYFLSKLRDVKKRRNSQYSRIYWWKKRWRDSVIDKKWWNPSW